MGSSHREVEGPDVTAEGPPTLVQGMVNEAPGPTQAPQWVQVSGPGPGRESPHGTAGEGPDGKPAGNDMWTSWEITEATRDRYREPK